MGVLRRRDRRETALAAAALVVSSLILLVACSGGPLDAWSCDCLSSPPPPGGDTGGASAGADGAGPVDARLADVDRCELGEPLPVDILWIVDSSSSMCQEQLALASGFARFLTALQAAGDVDIRTAVTTTNVLEPTRRGKLNATAAVDLPPLCHERRVFPAHSDLHCECAACAGWSVSFATQRCNDEPGFCPGGNEASETYESCLAAGRCETDPLAWRWILEDPVDRRNLYNQNGSVNASCVLRCGDEDAYDQAAADAVCREVLDDEAFVCQTPGGDTSVSGCLVPPDRGICPERLPAVLPDVSAGGGVRYGLETFPCIASVGVEQTQEANLEQGMWAAWLALSEDGPYPAQICAPDDPALADAALSEVEKRARCRRVFLRDGALLVLVFLSDEDDCSVAPDGQIDSGDYSRCAMLGDAETEPYLQAAALAAGTTERPLLPVSDFVTRFSALRREGEVFVAAIAGDVWEPERELTPLELDAARQAYFVSKTDTGNALHLRTSVCASPFGTADLGYRYIRLAEAFGSRGFFSNICSSGGLTPTLQAIAEAIAHALPCADR